MTVTGQAKSKASAQGARGRTPAAQASDSVTTGAPQRNTQDRVTEAAPDT